jgi:IS5 family transposase
MIQVDFFTEMSRLSRLSQIGDPLERVSRVIEFEQFRPILDKVFKKEPIAPGGRPPWDYVLMFKILLLQQWYSIADDLTEFLINDRLSFQRFLGLSLGSKVPDAKTIWLFRENLTKAGADRELFDLFAQQMEAVGVITRKGSLVDATFVDAPKQRNTRDENQKIKDGDGSGLWEGQENKRRQKDTDARWTKKNNETHYGYKDHVKVDKDSKLIVDYSVTDAAVHDSKEVVGLVDERDEVLYGDSAYAGDEIAKELLKKNPGIKLMINEKGYRNRQLTDEQKANNCEKSRVRVRVEHVFGHMTNTYKGIFVRAVGIARAQCQIGLKNLAYNLQRYECLTRL